MNAHSRLIAGVAGAFLVVVAHAQPLYRNPNMKVPYKAAPKAFLFPLSDVRLLPGPFKHAEDLDADYLLKLEPDRLLSRFREYAGLTPKAEAYGGWERDTISGHSLGHYLSAVSLMYAATGNPAFKERAAYVVSELAEVQKAHKDGFVGGFPRAREVFAQIKAGDIRSAGFDLNGLWVPWYNIHKTMQGLIDAVRYCGNEQALQVLDGLAGWTVETTANLTDDQWQRMLACEHGGMNEVMAEAYALTGKAAYLETARRFYHKRILDPLAAHQDPLTGVHANTQIPKIIGAARIYELTGDDRFHAIADTFWDVVTRDRSYVTGGNSDGEYFPPKEEFSEHVGSSTTETCNTYNMLKLTRHVFGWDPEARVADYYERALYNHILASQNPTTGAVCYFVPLKTGSEKNYQPPFNAFTCCVGTGMENHARYGEFIYATDGKDALYVNLFIASRLDWKSKGVTVTQETGFPEKPASRLVVQCRKPVRFTLLVRKPFWAGEGYSVSVNGKPAGFANAEGYVPVSREWKSGDTVDIALPMSLRTEGFADNPRRLALMYGPLVLSAEIDPKQQPPVIVAPGNAAILAAVSADSAKPLTFSGDPAVFRTVDNTPTAVTLIPFYRMHDRPYAVYWDTFTEPQWSARQAEYRAELEQRRQLEAKTVDFVQPGEMQPERDHNFQGEKTNAGEAFSRKYRDAYDGGWFSFDVKVLPDKPMDLVFTYWGSDRYRREFEILVNGTKVATQRLETNARDRFFDVTYPVPEALTKGLDKVTVRVQALPGMMAGGVYGIRVMPHE
jgi:DUF1680 family protein